LSGAPVLGALGQELGRLTDLLQPEASERDTLAVVDVDRAEIDRRPAGFEVAYKRRAGELEHLRVDLLGRYDNLPGEATEPNLAAVVYERHPLAVPDAASVTSVTTYFDQPPSRPVTRSSAERASACSEAVERS
jgi:hypothetical protein